MLIRIIFILYISQILDHKSIITSCFDFKIYVALLVNSQKSILKVRKVVILLANLVTVLSHPSLDICVIDQQHLTVDLTFELYQTFFCLTSQLKGVPFGDKTVNSLFLLIPIFGLHSCLATCRPAPPAFGKRFPCVAVETPMFTNLSKWNRVKIQLL